MTSNWTQRIKHITKGAEGRAGLGAETVSTGTETSHFQKTAWCPQLGAGPGEQREELKFSQLSWEPERQGLGAEILFYQNKGTWGDFWAGTQMKQELSFIERISPEFWGNLCSWNKPSRTSEQCWTKNYRITNKHKPCLWFYKFL